LLTLVAKSAFYCLNSHCAWPCECGRCYSSAPKALHSWKEEKAWYGAFDCRGSEREWSGCQQHQ